MVHMYWTMTPLTLQHQSEKNVFKSWRQKSGFLLENKVSKRKAEFNPVTWGLHTAACASPTPFIAWKSHPPLLLPRWAECTDLVHEEPEPLCSFAMVLQLADAQKNGDGT